MKKNSLFFKKFFLSLLFVLILSGLIKAYEFYDKIYHSNISLEYKTELELFIPSNATFQDVVTLLNEQGILSNVTSFLWTAKQKKYTKKIKPGRYLIKNGMSNNDLVNLLRSGSQTPINVTFNNVRTLEQFSSVISKQLELDSLELYNAFRDSSFLNSVELSQYNVVSLLLPNTYEFYWNVSIENFISRMVSEHYRFWTKERIKKAKERNLSPAMVSTLASIVEKETLKRDEQPVVAGLYLNRLKHKKKLQSDPTVIFALNDFTIKRVLDKDLKIESLYNTYLHVGLPPGPITIPSISALDAVLNSESHDFIFMCAKEDFSGYHNFAITYAQHLNNAKKYRNALNNKGIKR